MRRFQSLLLVVVALLCSCSVPENNTSSHEPDLTNLPPERIAELLYWMWCDRDQRCQERDWSDVDFCVAMRTAEEKGLTGSAQDNARSIAAGETVYDPDAFRQCLLAIRALACDTDLLDWNWRVAIPACGQAFQGQRKEGDSCVSSVSCAADSRCFHSPDDFCQATCQKLGEGCFFDAWCQNGDVCDDTTHQCRPPNPAPGTRGQPCGERNSCTDGLACLPVNDTTVCTTPHTNGGACGLNYVCGDGLHCDWQSEQCVPDQPVAGENGFCGNWDDSNAPSCAPGLLCVPNDDGTNGRCVKQKKRGEPCTKLLECGVSTSNLICDTQAKKCVDRPQTGPCPATRFGDFCAPLKAFCDQTTDPEHPTCRPFKAAGETCDDDSECGADSDLYCWHRNEGPAICAVAEPACE